MSKIQFKNCKCVKKQKEMANDKKYLYKAYPEMIQRLKFTDKNFKIIVTNMINIIEVDKNR